MVKSSDIRDLFHVYLNKFEFHFLQLHINKTSQFCFLINNRCVPFYGLIHKMAI